MKGTMHLIRVAGVLLGLVAALACSTPVRAQDLQGKFVLPSEVQWQGSTLSAGEYHFTLSSTPSGMQSLFILDARHRVKMLVMSSLNGDFTGQSALTIVNRNGKRYVSSLALEPIRSTLVYFVPNQKKGAKRELEASVQIIPVQFAGS